MKQEELEDRLKSGNFGLTQKKTYYLKFCIFTKKQ